MHYIRMIPTPFYIFFLVLAGLLLLVFAYSLFSTPRNRKNREPVPLAQGKVGENGVCPLCTSLLTNGAQIKSALFPGGKERICHIFGCPHCHPYKEVSVKRTCPVCKKAVPQEGYLIARLFERPNQKRHVHILGCTVCRVPPKR